MAMAGEDVGFGRAGPLHGALELALLRAIDHNDLLDFAVGARFDEDGGDIDDDGFGIARAGFVQMAGGRERGRRDGRCC